MPEAKGGGVAKSYRNKVRKKTDAELSNYLFGKVPPQARDLEDAVLGAMMLQKAAVSEVIDILRPDHFYHESNKKIFTAISNLLSAANIEYHARIVAQKYVQRELINISTNIINDAYEDTTDVFELLQKAEQQIFAITDQNLRRGYETADKLITKAIEEIEVLKNRESDLTGVPTGLYDLDMQTAGWQKSDLVIIAARPGMGKTSFVLSMARNAAVQFNRKIALFSLEMSAVQLTKRLIASETEIALNKLRNGNLEEYEWVKLVEKTKELGDAELIIDDTPAINIFELRAKCRRLKQQHDIDMVIIDYLQLMSGMSDGKSFNREQEISNISRSLKTIAKELDIPVIALSQLSRAVETRGGNKRPMLSDLRESGAIEQDADLVLFLYRPEYYGMDELDDGTPSKGLAEVIIAKHRNGPTGSVITRFVGQYAKFVNLQESDPLFAGLTPLDDAIGSEPKTITLKSSMNDNKKPDDDDTEVPF